MAQTELSVDKNEFPQLKAAFPTIFGYAFWWTYLYSNGINGPSWLPVVDGDLGLSHFCRFFTYLTFALVIAVIWIARKQLSTLVSRKRLNVECSIVASIAFLSFSLGSFRIFPSWSMAVSASIVGAASAVPIVAYWEKIVSANARRACTRISLSLVLGALIYLGVAGIGMMSQAVATGLCALCPLLPLALQAKEPNGAEMDPSDSEAEVEQLQKYPYALLIALFAYGIVFGLILAMNSTAEPHSFWTLTMNAIFVGAIAGIIFFMGISRQKNALSIARIYRPILPLIGTGFILFPLLGPKAVLFSSGIVIAGYACSRIFAATIFSTMAHKLPDAPLAYATMACLSDAGGIAIGSFLGWLLVFEIQMQTDMLQNVALVACGLLTLLTTLFLTDSGISTLWGFCGNRANSQGNAPSKPEGDSRISLKAADYRLTPREREVFQALMHGKSAQAIADELVISKATVLTHIKNIYAKAGVHSRAQLVSSVYEASNQPPKQ